MQSCSNRPVAGIVETLDIEMLDEIGDYSCARLLRAFAVVAEHELGGLRRFIGLIDAGEILDLSGERLFVKTLRVARDALFERRVDEDLDEFASVRRSRAPSAGRLRRAR